MSLNYMSLDYFEIMVNIKRIVSFASWTHSCRKFYVTHKKVFTPLDGSLNITILFLQWNNFDSRQRVRSNKVFSIKAFENRRFSIASAKRA